MPAPTPVRDYAAEEAEEQTEQYSGYVVIATDEDGDVHAQLLDRETLIHRLDIGYWGQRPILQIKRGDWLDLRDRSAVYIIKGESIAPKVKRVVTAWDVP